MKKQEIKNRIIALLLTVVFSVGLFPADAYAISSTTEDAIVSNHLHDNDYTDRSSVADCYIADNKNGTFTRVENMGDIIMTEQYLPTLQLITRVFLPMELPLFGGFYSGINYNFLVFGRENPNHDNGLECIRIVRYSKDWIRLDSTSITNCNVAVPFYGCNSDFAEYGDKLYMRLGHMGYDGKQGLLTITSSISQHKQLSVQFTQSSGNFKDVAATYIDAADGVVTAADHILGSSRSLMFTRYSGNNPGYAKALELPGKEGDTTPNTNLGGYETSDQYRIMVGSTTPMTGGSANRNVYIAAVPKNAFATQNVEFAYVTGYANGDTMTAMRPFLVKVDGDHFVVLWELRDGYSETGVVNYVYVNGSGQMTSPVYSIEGCLSDCNPVAVSGQVVWYSNNGRETTLYAIPAMGSTVSPTDETLEAVVYNGFDYSKVFDFQYYINAYPDMRVLYFHDPAGALEHFVTSGMAEGRQGCDNFNINAYIKYNQDLVALYGSNLPAYYIHFVLYGFEEGRKAR